MDQISDYSKSATEKYPIRNGFQIIAKTLEVIGFLVGKPGYGPAYTKEHQEKMQQWLADGSFKSKLHITEGIDNAAHGLVGMLNGENFGKAVLKIKPIKSQL